MIKPSLDVLMSTVDSKYTLVTLASKRAREIMKEDGFADQVKPVTAALKEIATHQITYERIKDGIK
ncbi:MAG: DNA-directed RNA polymerase subunit omega [Negativicutes bacterium]|nr:DNA-directed RNA polymerase subunit omega [Negativicutes bacterium]